VAYSEIVVLRENVISIRADLTAFVLGENGHSLDHGDSGRQTGGKAWVQWSVRLPHEVLERRRAEVHDRGSDSGGSCPREQTLRDQKQSKETLSVEPDDKEENPSLRLLHDASQHDDPCQDGNRRVHDCIVGEPASPVSEIAKAHHSHGILDFVFLFLYDTISRAIDWRHIHNDDKEAEDTRNKPRKVILDVRWQL